MRLTFEEKGVDARVGLGLFYSHLGGRYHGERNHQRLSYQLIAPAFTANGRYGGIVRHERLGGLLNEYHQLAA